MPSCLPLRRPYDHADAYRARLLLPLTISRYSRHSPSITEACLLLFFYEILVDSTLTTRRIGEQKFSCVQFAHNVASEVIENFRIFV